jgi:hypothetical protein
MSSLLAAQKNNIQNLFLRPVRKLEKKTVQIFFQWHPQLSVRSPKGLFSARATDFASEAGGLFFRSFEPVFNRDETVITVVQHKHSKVLGLKAKRSDDPEGEE